MVERIRLNLDKKADATKRDATEVRRIKASTDKVGYGSPPKHSQFKPGQSGNFKGRPKGIRNFKTDVHATLRSLVKITKDGRVRRITTQRASLEKLRADAFKCGNQRANEQLIRLAEKYPEPNVTVEAPLEASDQAILDSYVRRMTQAEN